MTEPADTEHRDEIGGAGAGDLDRLVRGHARAGQRRRVERIDAGWDLDDVAGVRRGVLAEGAVERVAHVLLLKTQRLTSRDAVVARAARIPQPGHRDAVADSKLAHTRAQLGDDADALVAGDERRRRLDRPVAMRGVDIGVAQATRLDPHSHLPVFQTGRGGPAQPSAARRSRARRLLRKWTQAAVCAGAPL